MNGPQQVPPHRSSNVSRQSSPHRSGNAQYTDEELEFEVQGSMVSRLSSRSPAASESKTQSKRLGNGCGWIILKAISVLLLILAMIGACLAGFMSEEQRKRAEFRDTVADLGQTYANEITRQVRSSVSSVRALEAMIAVDDKNLTIDNFEAMASTLIETYGGITNVQLAPRGTVVKIHPLISSGMDNTAALGHALLVDPSRRAGALATIERQHTTVVGPVLLLQGGVGIIARHPIFTKFAPEFLPPESWTKAGVVYANDCSTPEARRANCYFPGPPASDGSPTYFWGFTTMLTLVSDLLAPVDLHRLETGQHRIGGVSRFSYDLRSVTPHSSMADVDGVFAHSSDLGTPDAVIDDPVEVGVHVEELGMHFQLRLAPRDGWPLTSSDFWVQVALMLPLTMLVGFGLGFTFLGNLRKTYMRARGLEQYRQSKVNQGILGTVSELDKMHFPMCVMAVEVFEGLGRLITHEAARDEGRLRFVDTTEIMREIRDKEGVVFVSHQWSGFDEPDPEGVQYRAMVEAVQQLQKQGVRCRWIWVDYSCIPQRNKTQQQNAIDSLTVYVAHSSVFVAVAPSCKHAERGTTLDMNSYNCRGWCRLEQLSYLAASVCHDAPAAYASTDFGLGPLWGADKASTEETALAVCDGTFTCCSRGHPDGCPCDKTRLVGVMLGIYWRLLAWRRDLPETPERMRSILERLQRGESTYFPASAPCAMEGQEASVEVFGDMVSALRELFEAEAGLRKEERIAVSPPSKGAEPAAAKEEVRIAVTSPPSGAEPAVAKEKRPRDVPALFEGLLHEPAPFELRGARCQRVFFVNLLR